MADSKDNKEARIQGAVILAIGLFLLKWQVYDPLHAAEQKIQKIWTSSTLTLIAILLPVIGVCYLVFGAKAKQWTSKEQSMSDWRGVLRVIAVASVCFGTYIFIQRKLREQGYH
jgi:uncharacterized protein YjeT (DUF2065 family)